MIQRRTKMEVSIKIAIPDEILKDKQSDASRRILEEFALEGFRSGQLTVAQVRRILDLETRMQVHEFLATRGVPWVDYTVEDAERERKLLEKVLPE